MPLSSPPLSRSKSPRPRHRFWAAAALLLAALALGVRPALWLRERVRADQDALQVKHPPLEVEPRERVLVVSPHLDDETLGAGGLIAHLTARGVPVRVVFLTNGDGSGSTILALNFSRGRRFSFVESALLRQREALAALAKLGLSPRDVAFLGYPDGDLQTLWDSWDGAPVRSRFTKLTRVPYANAPGAGSEFRGANLLRDLAAQARAFRPTRLLSTHGADAHPDHWSADAFSRLALQVLGVRLGAAIEHDGFVVHHGIFPLPHGEHHGARLNVPAALLGAGTSWRDFNLSPQELRAKHDALEEYVSQLVFTPNYLRAFVRQNEPLGQAAEFQDRGEWSDEAQESWALAKRPSADIRAVSVESGTRGLEITLRLGAAPAQSTSYVVGVKSVFEDGSVQAHRVTVRRGRDEVSAREVFSGRSVPARIKADELRLSMPWDSLQRGARPARLVVDASTWNGELPAALMLDRTESRAVALASRP